MDFKTDDERIKEALVMAKESGIDYHFRSIGNASTFHPNTVKVLAQGAEEEVEVIGESRGGGVIRIREVNGFDSNFTASAHTLIFEASDVKGSVAFITNVLSHDDCNIATMTVSRDVKAGRACLILEMDSSLREVTLHYLQQLSWVHKVINIPNID